MQRIGHREDRIVDDHGRDFIARRHRFPANSAGFLLAPVLWFAWFIAVYSVQGAGCAIGLDETRALGFDALRLLLALITLAAAAGLVALGAWSFLSWNRLLRDLEEEEHHRHGYATFLAYGALLHAGLFLVAILWSGIPVLFMDACDALGST